MSLVPDYGDSSNSDSSDGSNSDTEEIVSNKTENNPPVTKIVLPKPFGNDDNEEGTTSVFKNPYTEAENAKTAALQKHVKMVETKDNILLINGKKICWNYRKGRCRFGHNCKFAHDSDVQKSEEELKAERQMQRTVICQSEHNVPPNPELVGIKGQNQKRKRPGLTQGITPGKKVMKQYMKNK